jgi:uncharacterized protein
METTKVIRRRAEEGDADALFRLGYRIAFGQNRPHPTDWAAVVRLWKEAARLGDDRAQFYIGTCYDHGHGVTRNVAVALQWYETAAGQGHLTSLSYLAGDGVVASRRWARHWLARAASQGSRKAKTQLRRLSGAEV